MNLGTAACIWKFVNGAGEALVHEALISVIEGSV